MKPTLLLCSVALLLAASCKKTPITHNYYCCTQWAATYTQHICKDTADAHCDTMKAYTDHEISTLLDKNNYNKFTYPWMSGCADVPDGYDNMHEKCSMTCAKL